MSFARTRGRSGVSLEDSIDYRENSFDLFPFYLIVNFFYAKEKKTSNKNLEKSSIVIRNNVDRYACTRERPREPTTTWRLSKYCHPLIVLTLCRSPRSRTIEPRSSRRDRSYTCRSLIIVTTSYRYIANN